MQECKRMKFPIQFSNATATPQFRYFPLASVTHMHYIARKEFQKRLVDANLNVMHPKLNFSRINERMYYCHQNHYQPNLLGIFPGSAPVRITKLITGEFSPGSSLQDSVHGIRSECHRIGERKCVVGNGPEKSSN